MNIIIIIIEVKIFICIYMHLYAAYISIQIILGIIDVKIIINMVFQDITYHF